MENVDYRVDLRKLPFADSTYGLVLASIVFDYIPDDRAAMAEIRRILKPDGIAILPVSVTCERTVDYAEPNPNESYMVRACGMDYFERDEAYFSRVERICSDAFPDKYQLFIYEDRSRWPNKKCPMRSPMSGEKHLNVVPVCYV
jgi:ubiquinone/menaquinone biosynthesis C-methylase UbiE